MPVELENRRIHLKAIVMRDVDIIFEEECVDDYSREVTIQNSWQFVARKFFVGSSFFAVFSRFLQCLGFFTDFLWSFHGSGSIKKLHLNLNLRKNRG